MADVHTQEQRSYNMSQIRSRDTKPEIILRKLLFGDGYRGFRVKSDLPGKPDIVYTKYRVAIFVDGCFWHKCPQCFQKPATNAEFWEKKITGNVKRDEKINEQLNKDNWNVVRIWEHEIKNEPEKCIQKIIKTLKMRGYPDGNKNS